MSGVTCGSPVYRCSPVDTTCPPKVGISEGSVFSFDKSRKCLDFGIESIPTSAQQQFLKMLVYQMRSRDTHVLISGYLRYTSVSSVTCISLDLWHFGCWQLLKRGFVLRAGVRHKPVVYRGYLPFLEDYSVANSRECG